MQTEDGTRRDPPKTLPGTRGHGGLGGGRGAERGSRSHGKGVLAAGSAVLTVTWTRIQKGVVQADSWVLLS